MLTNGLSRLSGNELSLLSKILAAVIWVDENLSEQEIAYINELTKAIGTDVMDLSQSVNREVTLLQELSPAVVSSYLKDAASQVPDEYKMNFLQCAVQLILSDQLISYAEMSVILALASAFELDAEYAMLLLAQCVHDGDNVKIDWNNTLL